MHFLKTVNCEFEEGGNCLIDILCTTKIFYNLWAYATLVIDWMQEGKTWLKQKMKMKREGGRVSH